MQLPDAQSAAVTFYIVIVLYKTEPLNSITYRSLLRSLAEPMECVPDYKILLYDNTPTTQRAEDFPHFVEYRASNVNTGLSDAYNLAVAQAQLQGFEWLLTLDQDTDLPVDFIQNLTKVAKNFSTRPEIAAVVPHVSTGARDVSPNWFAGGVFPRWFPKGYQGAPDQAVYAFNSGTLIRVSVVMSIGGYSPLFWLDYCDGYIYRQIEKSGLKVYIAGHIHLQHDFSLLDASNKMSLFRYQNALEAGSAFYDLEMSWLAGADQTLRLLLRYIKQCLHRDNPAIRRATITMFFRRLFVPRARRTREWVNAQNLRIQQTSLRM
ncbi:glycosyltransferase [Silvibacterium sp.]|uniref:glycosyltransferase n=1 Tax=Silvibacterium sp. TaxID=1964179 RepID=UPI0039E4C47C